MLHLSQIRISDCTQIETKEPDGSLGMPGRNVSLTSDRGAFVFLGVLMRFSDVIWRRFDDAFKESGVVRNALGEFSKKGNEPVVFGKHEKSRARLAKEHRAKTLQEFYGEELPKKDIKGRRAVLYMLEERRGFIRGAFHRDGLGDIDLVWGDSFAGLCHIFEQRMKHGQPVGRVIYKMSSTLANGRIEFERCRGGSVSIRNGNVRVCVTRTFKGEERRMILSSYEIIGEDDE